MVKKKSFKKYYRKIKKSKTYRKLLDSDKASSIIEDVTDKLSKIDFGDEMAEAVVNLMTFLTKGTTAVKFIAAGAILYFLAPLDVIPDVIPCLGYGDDFVVLGVAIDQICKIYESQ